MKFEHNNGVLQFDIILYSARQNNVRIRTNVYKITYVPHTRSGYDILSLSFVLLPGF